MASPLSRGAEQAPLHEHACPPCPGYGLEDAAEEEIRPATLSFAHQANWLQLQNWSGHMKMCSGSEDQSHQASLQRAELGREIQNYGPPPGRLDHVSADRSPTGQEPPSLIDGRQRA